MANFDTYGDVFGDFLSFSRLSQLNKSPDRGDAWTTFRNVSGMQFKRMQNDADEASSRAGMPCCLDCGRWPLGLDAMDGSHAWQPARSRHAAHQDSWLSRLRAMAIVRVVVCLRALCPGGVPHGGHVRRRHLNGDRGFSCYWPSTALRNLNSPQKSRDLVWGHAV